MHNIVTKKLAAIALLTVMGAPLTLTAQTVETRIGKLDFDHGVPTPQTVTKLYDEMDFQRACQLYLCGLPAVTAAQSRLYIPFVSGAQESRDVVMFEGYRNLSGLLTANVTTHYVGGGLDLATHGPTVVEIPAGLIAGSAMDGRERPLTDFGITGPDQGKGARYLFVGPGQETPDAPPDAVVVHSPTLTVPFYYRALDPDPVKAEALKKGVRVYPWSQRSNPPATRYLTPDSEKILQMPTLPGGLEYWERVASFINQEPVENRDRFFVAMLKPLGIEKGKPFRPDERQKKILTEAAFVGEAMAKANDFAKRLPDSRYRPDAQWDYVIVLDPVQDLADYSQLDERAAYFYEGIFITKAMKTKTPGVGQAYLGGYRDKDGHALDGANTYHLRVPPNPPAKQFWSITLYDVDTRALIQNKEQIADRSSRMADLVKNADGSVDLYFGPKAPKGFENNWIPTVPGRAWFCWFRLYAPLEAYFDKSWLLPDFEKVSRAE